MAGSQAWDGAFPEPSEGACGPAVTLVLDFQPLDLGDSKLLLFKPFFCGTCQAA